MNFKLRIAQSYLCLINNNARHELPENIRKNYRQG